MFNDILPRFNVNTTYIDGTDIQHFADATKPNTAIYYLRSPNSWTYELQDLRAVAALAKEHGIITICDNRLLHTGFQKSPLHMVLTWYCNHTKYIGGHSDTVTGVLSGSKAMIKRIFNSEYLNIGSGIQPFNAWLLIRGLERFRQGSRKELPERRRPSLIF